MNFAEHLDVVDPPKPNYFWQWAAIIVPLIAGMIFLPRFLNPSTSARFIVHAGVGNSNWFLIAKLPEAPPDAAALRAAKIRLDQWITTIIQAGFQPILLSDVMGHHYPTGHLPDKAIALVFDPGYRSTYDAFAPVLAKHGIPAVWITREDRIKAGDFRYLSRHVVNLMRSSGLWDVATRRAIDAPFELLPNDSGDTPIAAMNWKTDGSRRARNSESETVSLHRLVVQPDWTSQQLLDQLSVEVPLSASSYLHVQTLSGHLQALSSDSSIPVRFDLAAAPSRRVASVWWPSTQGTNHFSVELSLDDLAGELWLFLRSDEKTGDGMRVGFSRDFVSVTVHQTGAQKQIAVFHPIWLPNTTFVCRLILVDDTLRIYANDVYLGTIQVPDPLNRQSQFGMMAFDRIRGLAQAKNITLLFTPLSKDLIKTIQSFSQDRAAMAQEDPTAPQSTLPPDQQPAAPQVR